MILIYPQGRRASETESCDPSLFLRFDANGTACCHDDKPPEVALPQIPICVFRGLGDIPANKQ